MQQADREVLIGDEQLRDNKGWLRLPRERRAEVVKEYEASGLTQGEFARRAGLNATTFAHWVQCARREVKTLASVATPVAVPPRFVEGRAAAAVAPAVPATPASRLSVSFPDGVVVRGDDPGGAGRARSCAADEQREPPMSLPPLGLPANLRIYLAVEPMDMREQYYGLWALAEQQLRLDPFCGALFVFTNKTRDRIKLLHGMAPAYGSWRNGLRSAASVGRPRRTARRGGWIWSRRRSRCCSRAST